MDAPVTAQNWTTHPRIVEIRRLDALVRRETAGARPSDGVLCEDGPTRQLWTSRSGALARYDGGSQDSAVSVQGTYDARRRLRFVFVQAGAVNGTRIEYRYYFGADGKRLWRRTSQVGPGYTFTPGLFEKRFGADFSGLDDLKC